MPEEFISEGIQPVPGSFDTSRMAAGEPGIPHQFRWRSRLFAVSKVLRTWRETGPCHHGSGEAYVRKHWFDVQTESGEKLKIYFERQAKTGSSKRRWWLFSMERSGSPNEAAH